MEGGEEKYAHRRDAGMTVAPPKCCPVLPRPPRINTHRAETGDCPAAQQVMGTSAAAWEGLTRQHVVHMSYDRCMMTFGPNSDTAIALVQCD